MFTTYCVYTQCSIDLCEKIKNLFGKMYLEGALMSKSHNILLLSLGYTYYNLPYCTQISVLGKMYCIVGCWTCSAILYITSNNNTMLSGVCSRSYLHSCILINGACSDPQPHPHNFLFWPLVEGTGLSLGLTMDSSVTWSELCIKSSDSKLTSFPENLSLELSNRFKWKIP